MARTGDLCKQVMDVLVLEREAATEHDKEDDSAAPDVDLGPFVQRAANDLWSCVVRTATGCLEELAVHHAVRQAKVGYFDLYQAD